MINVTTHILKFRKFLLDCWPDIDALMEDHDWHDDGYFIDEWLQSNWELLVERQLLKKAGHVNSFGIYYGRNRYAQKESTITHEIICRPKDNVSLIDEKSNEPIPRGTKLIFHIFLKKMGGLYPPFDSAGVYSKNGKNVDLYYVPVSDVEFFMEEVLSTR